MKDYQGPAYQKSDVNYQNRRFNRDFLSSSKDRPFTFKSALEEKQETERGHKPVYHHDQPWRDQAQRRIESQRQVLEEQVNPRAHTAYRPSYQGSNHDQGYNEATVWERMSPLTSQDEAQEKEAMQSRKKGLRLPQTRTGDWERPRASAMATWSGQVEGQEQRRDHRHVLDTFLEEPGRGKPRYSWQEHEEQEVSHQREVSVAQEKFQSLLENGRESQEVVRQAQAERFKPKTLPKPYQAPVAQAVTEVGVSREILQRMVKDKQDYLLFEM